MSKKRRILSLIFLYPVSVIYGWVMAIRNFMFDKGFLKQHSFPIPVIVVGNLTVGGAGKTPHTEYIIEKLRSKYHIGMLSRGYKRRTKGFVLAGTNSRPEDIGDEPYQMYRKFRHHDVMVAVCEDRVKGVEEMLKIDPKLSLVILDDAFQHRYVKPTISVVLTEHNRPAYNDFLLPFGRLREPFKALERADIVIVTKCPDEMQPMQYRIFKQHLDLYPYQKLSFTRYRYLTPVPLFPENAEIGGLDTLNYLHPGQSLLAITGVANPRPFIRYLRRFKAKVKTIRFSDHHNFSQGDMQEIADAFKALKSKDKYLITTEKDAVRLANNPYFPPALRSKSYYIPIAVEEMPAGEDSLENIINVMLRNNNILNKQNGHKK